MIYNLFVLNLQMVVILADNMFDGESLVVHPNALGGVGAPVSAIGASTASIGASTASPATTGTTPSLGFFYGCAFIFITPLYPLSRVKLRCELNLPKLCLSSKT